MKRLLALLLAMVMIIAFVGCSNEDIEAGPDSTDDFEEEVVNEITMTYGEDESSITLCKPEGAFFSVDPEDAQNAGDIVIMLADDYSWDAEIMGYQYYEGIGSNVPFVDYHFCGSVMADDYESYEEEATELDIEYEGNPVKLVRYTYKEVGDEEEYSECFVGFEYSGTEDKGLLGIRICSFEEELSDSYIADLFSDVFCSGK